MSHVETLKKYLAAFVKTSIVNFVYGMIMNCVRKFAKLI